MKVEPFIFRSLENGDDNIYNNPLNDNNNKNIEKIFSEDDIVAARKEGFQQGHQQGLAEGTNTSIEVEKQLTSAINNFGSQIEEFLDSYYNIIEVEKNITTQASIDIANKILLSYPNPNAIEAIKIMIDDVYDVAITKPKIYIQVHDSLREKLEEYINKIFNNDKYKVIIEIESVNNISPTDFSLKWDNGGIQRNTEKIWNEIEKILNHKRLELNPTEETK